MTRRIILSILALCLCTPAFASGGKKKTKNRLTFHLEGHHTDGQKMVFPLQMGNKKRFFQKTPLVMNKEIVAHKPFFAQDGTAGSTFLFNRAAINRVSALTTQNQGKWIVAMLNGRAVDSVYIDRPIIDGKLVIWQGLTKAEIIAFDYVIPHIGEDRKTWKKRLKDHKKARKAEIKRRKEEQKERNRRKS